MLYINYVDVYIFICACIYINDVVWETKVVELLADLEKMREPEKEIELICFNIGL